MGNAREGLTASRRTEPVGSLLTGTHLIDLVIIATLVEWAALVLLWKRFGRGVPPGMLSWMLLPGLCLMLAVRGVMIGIPWYGLTLLMLLAGLAHLIDLRSRWRC